jgi:amino acid adenylation domain-containing protein
MPAHTPQNQPFTRPIAPFEHWFRAFPKKISPVLNLCVEGSGTLDVDQLTRAVAIACDAAPGTRLVRTGRNWTDSGRNPKVRLVRAMTLNPDALHAIPQLRTPLPDSDGNTCEIVVFAEPGRTTVAFRGTHVVMDAHGLLLWARDVFRVLRGEQPLGAPSTAVIQDLDDQLYQQAADGPPPCLPALLDAPAAAGLGDQLWRRRTIDGNINGLSAKLAVELARMSGLPTAPISFPVNVRPFHPGVLSSGNLSLTVSLDVTPDETWEQVYQRILTVLAEQRGEVHAPTPGVLKVPVPAVRLAIRRLDRTARTSNRLSSTATVNNIGRIRPEWFGTDAYDPAGAYLVCPREPAHAVSVIAVEGDGRTDLTVSWWQGPRMSDQVDALLDRLCAALAPPANRTEGRLLPAREATPSPTVVARFREQVSARPDAIAVSGPDGEHSYADLDRRARIIAHALRECGIGRDQVVGLLADKTFNAVAGAWGALFAGAAYLPMDPSHPNHRVQALLADATAPVCLVTASQSGRACLPANCVELVLDDLPDEVPPPGDDTLPAPGDLAYVVYTSGSTGAPKGVEIEHQSLANYANWAIREHRIDDATRLPLLCSLSFDVAEISLILPLTVGGTVLLMREEISHITLDEVLENGATMLALTPSHLNLITRLDLRPRDVRTLIVIGEQFTRSVAARAQELFGPGCRIINLYGPAEATIAVGHHDFDFARDTAAAVPIGIPFDGVTYHVFDANRCYVAPGEVGELYIGGAQLARGYRGRPDLTRERFVRLADGSRAYRTGDIVRRLASGHLEYLGRTDDQLKILGHRIEPAEIAAALERHDAVSSAVVIARTRPGQRDKALCGYYTAAAPIKPGDLSAYLAERLPHYLVPAALVQVEQFPRSVNGKVAASALPDPFASNDIRPSSETMLLSGMEEAVARIWSAVLDIGVDRLRGASEFHELGGDSLALITMVAEVARDAVGPAGERAFVRRMPEIIGRTTISHVAWLATQVKTGQ